MTDYPHGDAHSTPAMSDPDRIWLEPACCADPYNGRNWADEPEPGDPCDEGVPWTEYIRADVAGSLHERAEKAERERDEALRGRHILSEQAHDHAAIILAYQETEAAII